MIIHDLDDLGISQCIGNLPVILWFISFFDALGLYTNMTIAIMPGHFSIYIYTYTIYIYLLSTSRSNLWSEQKLETHTSGSPRHDSIPAFLAKIGDFIIHDMRIPMNQPWFNHYNSMTDGFEHSSHLYDVHTMCITSNIYTCECHSNIMHMCMLHILHICIEYYRIYIQ